MEMLNEKPTTNAALRHRKIRPDSTAGDVISWVLERFSGQRIVITTQFGMEGCALIDMCARDSRLLRVVYVDTHFLFQETYGLCERMKERYPNVRFARHATALSAEQQAELHGPELWKRNPDLCCRIRKVEPLEDVLREVDVWMTGLRRSQSPSREKIQLIEWDWKFLLLKVNPLAAWSRRDVWEYVQANDVPYNPLHEQGYPNLGCTHCTRPVPGASITEYSRAGRWNGHTKTECGLHGDGI